MNEYDEKLERLEEEYENILDKIIKEFGADFKNYGRHNMTIIDKEEIEKIVKKKNFYFADSLDLGYRKDYLISLLLQAKRAYDKVQELRIKNANERKKDYQKNMTKEEYKRKYENKRKRKIKYRLKRTVIIAGLILAVGIGASAGITAEKLNNNNLASNVCVEYTVQEGDTYTDIEKLGLKDWGFSHYETKGPYRDSYKLYAGDKLIGRVTMQQADEMVEGGKTKIVTLEESLEKFKENNTAVGEFEKILKGESDFPFHNSEVKKL